jgi:hypothetical protein
MNLSQISASEILPGKRDGLRWVWPHERGTIAHTFETKINTLKVPHFLQLII